AELRVLGRICPFLPRRLVVKPPFSEGLVQDVLRDVRRVPELPPRWLVGKNLRGLDDRFTVLPLLDDEIAGALGVDMNDLREEAVMIEKTATAAHARLSIS